MVALANKIVMSKGICSHSRRSLTVSANCRHMTSMQLAAKISGTACKHNQGA